MKNNEQVKTFFSAQATSGNTKPAAPFAARQAIVERHASDPSSVIRSDRYPIPTSSEYRTRASE